jgi:hypothetical protein
MAQPRKFPQFPLASSLSGNELLLTWQGLGNRRVTLNTLKAFLGDGTEDSSVFLNVKTFDATGEGIMDDTIPIQTTIDNANGKWVYFPEGDYKITSTLNLPVGTKILGYGAKVFNDSSNESLVQGTGNVVIEGLEVEMIAPLAGSVSPALTFSGSSGTAQTLAGNVTSGDTSLTVPNGSLFSVDGWAYLSSSADFSSDAKTGELIKIKSISGNVLSLHGAILCDYLISDTASILPIVTSKDIIIKNVTVNGDNVSGEGEAIRFSRCERVIVDNFKSKQFQYSHIVFNRCVESTVIGGSGSKTGTQVGLNYGVAILNACYMVDVDGYKGDSMRHVVSIGGSQGVSRFISVRNCKGYNITDAGIDAHSSVHEHLFDGNYIHFSTGGTQMDGIISQGSSPIITNNQLFGVKREGILWQPLQKNTFTGGVSAIISNNKADNPLDIGTHNGIAVATEPSGTDWADIDSVIINNFQGSGFLNNIQVLARNAEIRKVSISNAVCVKPVRARSILIKSTNSSIDQVSIVGGIHETASVSTTPVIELEGTESNPVKNWNVVGGIWKRNSTGIGLRLLWTENGYEVNNTDVDISTKTLVQNSTGHFLDTRGGTSFNHITQTANHAGVFQPNPQHSWDMGGSANIPYNFAYRANGERMLLKENTTKDIYLGQIDSITDETGRVIIRVLGQSGIVMNNPTSIGFGGSPSGANYQFYGNVRINTVSNASGEFATFSGSNVLQKRTASEVRTDIGAIADAPSDNNYYVRRNGAWEILPQDEPIV